MNSEFANIIPLKNVSAEEFKELHTLLSDAMFHPKKTGEPWVFETENYTMSIKYKGTLTV